MFIIFNVLTIVSFSFRLLSDEASDEALVEASVEALHEASDEVSDDDSSGYDTEEEDSGGDSAAPAWLYPRITHRMFEDYVVGRVVHFVCHERL